MTDKALDTRRMKAQALRYKKPVLQGLCLDDITSRLSDMQEQCYNVRWSIDGDGYDYLCDVLGGDDEAQQFKLEFADLEAYCERMQDDLYDGSYWIPQMFDVMQVASGIGNLPGQHVLGYDEYEGDYFGLSTGYETNCAQDEAVQQTIKKLKKAEIVDQMGTVFRITMQFVALQQRFSCLKAVMDIITEDTKATMDAVRSIDILYNELDGRWRDYDLNNKLHEFEKICKDLPDMAWLQ